MCNIPLVVRRDAIAQPTAAVDIAQPEVVVVHACRQRHRGLEERGQVVAVSWWLAVVVQPLPEGRVEAGAAEVPLMRRRPSEELHARYRE